MNIITSRYNNFNNYLTQNTKRNLKQNNNEEKNNGNNILSLSYPKNYYLNNISFSGKQHEKIIDKLGSENFPSNEILEKFKNSDNSLYEIHSTHYSKLSQCKTLEEAKKIYPEFKDVIDAKDINTEKMGHTSVLRRIKEGKIDGLTLDNLSLELLKKHYSEIKSTKNPENYFNVSTLAANNLFTTLNIKKLDRNYFITLQKLTPEAIQRNSENMKRRWREDDGTMLEKMRQQAYNILLSPEVISKNKETKQTDEYRKKMSDSMSKRWANDDGTMLEKVRNNAKTHMHTSEANEKRLLTLKSDEYKEKRSKIAQSIWENDDGSKRETARNNAKNILNSPEILDKRRKIQQSDEYRNKQSQITQQMWDNDDGTRREIARNNASTILQSQECKDKMKKTISSNEHRAKLSEIRKEIWSKDDGTMREKSRQLASTVLQTPEVIAKRNEKLQSDEYREAYSLAYKRHPEITSVMKDIASTIPNLGIAIAHEKQGIANDYEYNLCLKFYKMCEDEMPGYKKIIGKEIHNILVEKGLKKE